LLPHPPRSFVAAVAGLSSMDMQSGIVPLRSSPSALWNFPCCLSSSRRTVGKKPFLKARRMITVAHRVNRLHQWLFGNFHFAVSVCLDGLPFSVQLVVLGLYIRQQIEQIKLRQLGGLPGVVCPVAGTGPPRRSGWRLPTGAPDCSRRFARISLGRRATCQTERSYIKAESLAKRQVLLTETALRFSGSGDFRTVKLRTMLDTTKKALLDEFHIIASREKQI